MNEYSGFLVRTIRKEVFNNLVMILLGPQFLRDTAAILASRKNTFDYEGVTTVTRTVVGFAAKTLKPSSLGNQEDDFVIFFVTNLKEKYPVFNAASYKKEKIMVQCFILYKKE